MRRKGDLTAGNILERLMSFALPFLFSSFMQAFYGMVDMWTVGVLAQPQALRQLIRARR